MVTWLRMIVITGVILINMDSKDSQITSTKRIARSGWAQMVSPRWLEETRQSHNQQAKWQVAVENMTLSKRVGCSLSPRRVCKQGIRRSWKLPWNCKIRFSIPKSRTIRIHQKITRWTSKMLQIHSSSTLNTSTSSLISMAIRRKTLSTKRVMILMKTHATSSTMTQALIMLSMDRALTQRRRTDMKAS